MSNIAIIMVEPNPSTLEKNHMMAQGLCQSGNTVTLLNLCHEKEFLDYFFKNYGNESLYSLDIGPSGRLFSGKYAITKLLNNCKLAFLLFVRLFKLTNAHPLHTIIIPTHNIEATLPATLVAKLKRIRLIPNIMEYMPSLKSFHQKKNILFRLSWRISLRFSDAYIVISRFLSDKLENKKKCFTLPAIYRSESEFTPAAHPILFSSNNKHILLYACSSGYTDLLQFCLSALSLLTDCKYELHITGKYSQQSLKQLMTEIKRLGISDNVKFTGFISKNALFSIQQESSALLMPLLPTDQHKARFPQKILEYMSMGKTVISTNVGEISEYFTDNENMYIDDTITPEGFAQKIKGALDDPKKMQSVGINGQQFVYQEFNSARWGDALSYFIKELK